MNALGKVCVFLMLLIPGVSAAQDGQQTPEYFVEQGDSLREQKKLAEAEQAYLRAIALKSDAGKAHLGLGEAYSYEEKFDAAVKEFELAMQLDPSVSPEALTQMVYIYTYRNDNRAAEYYRKLSDVKKPAATLIQPVIFLGRICGLKHEDGLFKTAPLLPEFEPEIRGDIAEVQKLFVSGDKDAIVARIREILEKNISSQSKAALQALIGKVYIKDIEKMAEGIACLKEAIRLNPSGIMGWIYLIEHYQLVSDDPQALNTAQELLKQDPHNKYGFFITMTIYHQMGNWAETIAWGDKLRELDPILFALVQDKYEEARIANRNLTGKSKTQ